jgi:hypothetical protein
MATQISSKNQRDRKLSLLIEGVEQDFHAEHCTTKASIGIFTLIDAQRLHEASQ